MEKYTEQYIFNGTSKWIRQQQMPHQKRVCVCMWAGGAAGDGVSSVDWELGLVDTVGEGDGGRNSESSLETSHHHV